MTQRYSDADVIRAMITFEDQWDPGLSTLKSGGFMGDWRQYLLPKFPGIKWKQVSRCYEAVDADPQREALDSRPRASEPVPDILKQALYW